MATFLEAKGGGPIAEFSCKPNAESLLYAEAPPKIATFPPEKAEIAQLVEHDLAKVGVAGSSPVFRSKGKSNVQNSGSAFFSEIY